MRGWAIVWSAFALVGCGGMSNTAQERAANDFGCSDVDVENVGGQSFTATGCGRSATYTCVRTATWGVACEHDDAPSSSPSRAVSSNVPTTPVATSVATPLRTAPTGVAGFAFGMAPDEAKTICEGAKHTFTLTGAEAKCDGFGIDLGVPGVAKLRFCSGKLCTTTLTLERNGETLEQSVVRWKRAIIDKYGTQTENHSSVPPGCSELASCISNNMGSVRVVWSWPSRESIELRVPTRDKPDDLRVELVYGSGQQQAANGL
jgi:hypothetical protein